MSVDSEKSTSPKDFKSPASFECLQNDRLPRALATLDNPPERLFYRGDLTLLQSAHKIAIVGTRKPNPYTKAFVAQIASKIARYGGIVVSGGALGVDIIAHAHAQPRTIMFSPSSLDILYPKSNAQLISQMMSQALVLSEYEREYMPHRYSFLERNRLVIAMSEVVIIPQADLYSGSMQSARLALELGKPLFVLPHRIGESEGTNSLLQSSKARAIYHIDGFIEEILGKEIGARDEVLDFIALNPSIEAGLERFGALLYEYELEGKIRREGGSWCLA